MNQFYAMKVRLIRNFSSTGNGLLTLALLASAVVVAIIALMPDHVLLKAAVLAYVVLP
jgi:hypothetical protein